MLARKTLLAGWVSLLMVKAPANLDAQGIPAAAPDINIALDGVVTLNWGFLLVDDL